MRTQSRPFRLTATFAVISLLFAEVVPLPALAQPAPAPAQLPDDPPTRVGRLAQITGTVSFHTQDETQWSPVELNYPVTAGNSFWTQPGAQATIEVSASRIVVAPETELDVAALTDTAFQATLPQGEAYLRIQAATPDQTYAIQTPRGLVTLASPGRYSITAGDTQNPTLITVAQGSAHISGPGVELDVAANQTATVLGTDTFQASVAPAQPDAFLTAMLNAERPPAAAPPAVVAAMPGGDDLSEYGTWADTTDYGQVWYPQVAPGWVPYREGQWAYVAPWGWTWVDSDPWGFAPFHYGRWAEIGGRWGWIPGGVVVAGPPVYAPALVAFFGVGAAVGIGIGGALAEGRIGWCPLGPREAYHPWYHASPAYVREVNIRHVTNITTINRNVTVNNFINRGAATVVPASAVTGSRPVSRFAQRVDPAQLAQVRPVIGTQPLRPAATTVGVTPGVARELRLPAAAGGARPAAPGPAIHATPAMVTPAAAGATVVHPGLPALHNPAQTTIPAAAGIHPIAPGTPVLRQPLAPGHVGPPPIDHGQPVVAPGAVPHGAPALGTTAHPEPLVRPEAPTVHPVPNTAALHSAPGTAPPPVDHTPPAAFHPAAPPVVHAVPAVTPPAPVAHTAPPAPAVHAPAPAAFHPPAPVVVHAPPPQVEHAAAPPRPEVHAPPPPAAHPAPAPHAAPAQEQHKKPGEP